MKSAIVVFGTLNNTVYMDAHPGGMLFGAKNLSDCISRTQHKLLCKFKNTLMLIPWLGNFYNISKWNNDNDLHKHRTGYIPTTHATLTWY